MALVLCIRTGIQLLPVVLVEMSPLTWAIVKYVTLGMGNPIDLDLPILVSDQDKLTIQLIPTFCL